MLSSTYAARTSQQESDAAAPQNTQIPGDSTPLVQVVANLPEDDTEKNESEPPGETEFPPSLPLFAEPLAPFSTATVLAEIETMQKYLGQYASIQSPNDLLQYLFQTSVMERNPNAAILSLAIDPALPEATQRYYLYKWSYIVERLQDTAPNDFPEDLSTATFPFTTGRGETFELEFVKDARGCWKISPATLLKTNTIFREILGNLPIRNHFKMTNVPVWMFQIFGGLTYLQWAILCIGLLIGFIAYWILQWTLYLFALAYTKVMNKNATKPSRTTWRHVASVVMVFVWYRVYTFVVSDPEWTTMAYYACATFIVIVLALISLKIVDWTSGVLRAHFKAKNSRNDDLVVPLYSRSMKALILCTGTITLSTVFELPVIGVVSGLGIGGVAIAFAAKETIGNFFGSVTVLADRPFMIGDWIVVGDIEGTVEAVGMRSTRIRTFYNSVVTIPNNNLTTAVIDNMGQRVYRRYRTYLRLQHNTCPDRIVAFCEGVREIIRQNEFTRKDVIWAHLSELKESSIDVMVTMFFIVPDTESEHREKGNILSNILRLAKAMDIRFAYPTQTVYIHAGENGENTVLPGDDPLEAGQAATVRVMNAEYPLKKAA